MVSVVRLTCAEDGVPPPGVRVLKAGDYALLTDAKEALKVAREKAQAMIDSAERELQTYRDRGYADGRAQSDQEAAVRLVESVGQSVDYLALIEDQLIGVVLTAVGKVLGSFDDAELTSKIARNALKVVRTQKRVTVRVAPGSEAGVRERVSEILKGYSSVGFLEVVADHRLVDQGCILETELGVVDASLETQLNALEKAMRARMGSANPDTRGPPRGQPPTQPAGAREGDGD
jgi:type III secretion protein L